MTLLCLAASLSLEGGISGGTATRGLALGPTRGELGTLLHPQSLQQSSAEREFVKGKSERKDEHRDGPSPDLRRRRQECPGAQY